MTSRHHSQGDLLYLFKNTILETTPFQTRPVVSSLIPGRYGYPSGSCLPVRITTGSVVRTSFPRDPDIRS
ncbi:MAG: hypothetical protein KatS3mg042_1595 [Rhodothermaceae bacterium]|nr:MAG: hypothetical protein KatS3mg042_1595 [Rhodothermaceae bacterium]